MGGVRFPALLCVLLHTTVVQVADEVMGMLPESVDFSYSNCRDEMLQMVTKPGGLLQRELNNNPYFKSMWQSNATCKKRIPGGTKEHMAALQSYVEADTKFQEVFNTWFYTKGRNSTSYQDFPFKSLYFLLTDAMRLLGKDMCQTVYSGTEEKYMATVGEMFSFRSFFPATFKFSDASEDTGNNGGTVFNITSCFVVSLDENVCEPEEMDLLIYPTEVFTVEAIRTVNNSNDKFTEITLIHSKLHSPFNCSSLLDFPTPEESSSNSSSSLLAPFLMVYFYTLAL
ncbi:erythroblast NAD(P)(+)--arginine ADP-ribosyltransferase [Myxocyprinus asiaticus]|uniref:erythroblast NAD(P)(+)--arginine ADP-ribosyltransferase n=1 Tax=Myxocyprinus asiaticus TaxID=70543 RepID=UPI002223751F|nr:erythroblast NAD(P)(+)--arginine ADP-ribosyltransferase [Myxocyprinus asiaticus]